MTRLALESRSMLWVAWPVLAGCYPETLTSGETDVVVTVRDPDRSYSALRTYALPDEIFDLCELDGQLGAAGAAGSAGEDFDCLDVNHAYDSRILDAIAQNMEELGFERVDDPEQADAVLVPGVTAQDNWYVYYPYCDYWYGWYYYPYCWYYPWTPTAVNYPIGTLLVYMLTQKDADAEQGRAGVAWLAVVRGILSSSSQTNADRAESGIDQAFAQSKYLGEGK